MAEEHKRLGDTGLVKGQVDQLAYLVAPRGLDRALDFWVRTMGAGPFFTLESSLQDEVFRGRPTRMTCRVGLAYMGEVQIEVIEPTNDGAGPYREWLERHPPPPVGGLYHHVMLKHEGYDEAYARLLEGGCRRAYDARSWTGDRVAYLEAFETTGGYVELLEAAGWPALCERIREASRNWDGSRPIRSFEEVSGDFGSPG